MLATWQSHIKDAARDGRTQYVLEQLQRHGLRGSAYSILSLCAVPPGIVPPGRSDQNTSTSPARSLTGERIRIIPT